MVDFVSDLRFQLWDYSASHDQLLLRSVMDESVALSENTDIIFSNVFYLDIPTTLDGLLIRELAERDAKHVFDRLKYVKLPDSKQVYCIESKDVKFFVGAIGFKIRKNKLHPAISSLDFPRGP